MGDGGAHTGSAVDSTRELVLRPNWNGTFAYDTLGGKDRPDVPSFVGRERLLHQLVGAMVDPAQRGTYLVSGYRGAGKTTLVVAATRLAGKQLQATPTRLLPIMLNVSEVSASLGETPTEEQALPISPRRLLVALLRRLATSDVGDVLQAKAKDAVDQVTAATFQARRGSTTSTTTEQVTERRASLVIADVWKVLAGLAALAAVALFGLSIWESARVMTLAAAAGLTGLAAASFALSRSTKRTRSAGESADTTITKDNSLQNMELTVQDILAELPKQHRRTVVIIEELDKLDDPDGVQLARWIRYFKNLFTQAPALFIFVTDKEYFDLVAERMARARELRTYAVEHTFFTHRVFVPRPSMDDAYQFLREVIDDEQARVELRSIEESDSHRVRNAANMELFERFVRYMLLRSEGHLFDLKQELEAHVGAPTRPSRGSTVLSVSETSLSPREQAMATLHFLVESKAKAYGFGESRGYANEAMRSYLYGLVRTIGSGADLPLAAFTPNPAESRFDLSSGDLAQIAAAVTSLINDLTAAGALVRIDGADAATVLRWEPGAELSLRLRGVLETHEAALAADLDQASELGAVVGAGGSLGGTIPDPAAVDAKAQRWREEAEALRGSERAALREVTEVRRGQLRDEVSALIAPTIGAHVDRLRARGWILTPARTDQRVWDVFTPATGRLLLTYGLEGAELQATIDGGQAQTANLPNVAIVAVAVGAPSQSAASAAPTLRGTRVVTLAVRLAERQPTSGPNAEWGIDTSTELFAAERWLLTRDAQVPEVGLAAPEVLFAPEGTSAADVGAVDLDTAIESWLRGTDRLLGIVQGADTVGHVPFASAVLSALSNADPTAYVVVEPLSDPNRQRVVEIERLAEMKRLVLTEHVEPLPPPREVGSLPEARVVRDLRTVSREESNVGGLAVVVPSNAGSLTLAGVELERLRPSLGRDLLQRSARLGDHQAIRRLVQLGVWTPEDLDARDNPEPPAFLLFEAAQDPTLTDQTTRVRLLVAASQRGATNARQPLEMIVNTSRIDAPERAEVAAAAFALAQSTTFEDERRNWLEAAAVRDHVPALLVQLRTALEIQPERERLADRLVRLGQAAVVAEIVDPVDHDAAMGYLDLGVRRDEPASIRALAVQLQGQDPERARELRALAEQREANPAPRP